MFFGTRGQEGPGEHRPTAAALATETPSEPSSCYLCGSDRLRLRFPGRGDGQVDGEAYRCTSFGHRRHSPIWKCEQCGLLFQSPMPDQAALLDAYRDVEDPVYEVEQDNRYFTFQRVVRSLGAGEGRRLLDVGCYCGYFLDVARHAGFRPEGLELSTWAASKARGLGFEVHNEALQRRAQDGVRYDVVTMWDVVEHLADPRAELQTALQLLEPGGRLYLSTIDAGSAFARVLGPRWPWLMDMHLYYFTRASITALLHSVGFDVVRIGHYTHVVSADYLFRKVAASFPFTAPVVRPLRAVVPGRWRIPVNVGDNMLVVAQRPAVPAAGAA